MSIHVSKDGQIATISGEHIEVTLSIIQDKDDRTLNFLDFSEFDNTDPVLEIKKDGSYTIRYADGTYDLDNLFEVDGGHCDVHYKKTLVDLIGKTVRSVSVVTDERADTHDELILLTDTQRFRFYHEQHGCENVELVDIPDNLRDILDHPLLRAEERFSVKDTPHGRMRCTFYELATINGSITLRWSGTSNGHYSESVYLDISDLPA